MLYLSKIFFHSLQVSPFIKALHHDIFNYFRWYHFIMRQIYRAFLYNKSLHGCGRNVGKWYLFHSPATRKAPAAVFCMKSGVRLKRFCPGEVNKANIRNNYVKFLFLCPAAGHTGGSRSYPESFPRYPGFSDRRLPALTPYVSCSIRPRYSVNFFCP